MNIELIALGARNAVPLIINLLELASSKGPLSDEDRERLQAILAKREEDYVAAERARRGVSPP